MVKHSLEPGEKIQLLHQIGELYELAGDEPQKAFDAFGRALKEDPSREDTQSRLDNLANQMGAFAEMVALVGELSDADAAATLTAMCAAGVAEAMQHCPSLPERVLVTGGGRHNPVLMQMLSVSLECPVGPVEDAGLDGDMLEAQAFAYLAVRVARGLPTSGPGTTGVRASVGGGIISVPE